MFGRLVTFISFLSLCLCAAAVVAWVWSDGKTRELTVRWPRGGSETLRTCNGTLFVRHTPTDPNRLWAADGFAVACRIVPPIPPHPLESHRGSIHCGIFNATSQQSGYRKWGPVEAKVVSDREVISHRFIADDYELNWLALRLHSERIRKDHLWMEVGDRTERERKAAGFVARHMAEEMAWNDATYPERLAVLREKWHATAPLWLVVSLFAGMPAAWTAGRTGGWARRRLRHRRRRRRGQCIGCGYDLSASPVRCPECGVAR